MPHLVPRKGTERLPSPAPRPDLALAPWGHKSQRALEEDSGTPGVEIRKDFRDPFATPSLFVLQMGKLRFRGK